MMEIEELKQMKEKLISDILSAPTNYPYESVEHKKEVILEYRKAINKPLDPNWLNRQPNNVINGIFYQIVNGDSKKRVNENQMEMDDLVNSEEFQRLQEEYEFKKLMDELEQGYETYPTMDSIRSKYPNMSDIALMEKLINYGIENKWDMIPLELHTEVKRIIEHQTIKSPDNNGKSR